MLPRQLEQTSNRITFTYEILTKLCAYAKNLHNKLYIFRDTMNI